ncbi:MAG TPA: hypothetical protein VK196_04055 [Magnetospirillum sp.]|nr:hypothetical protein [Magnetospirillum sp.]
MTKFITGLPWRCPAASGAAAAGDVVAGRVEPKVLSSQVQLLRLAANRPVNTICFIDIGTPLFDAAI